jgi:hypothetical protein
MGVRTNVVRIKYFIEVGIWTSVIGEYVLINVNTIGPTPARTYLVQ